MEPYLSRGCQSRGTFTAFPNAYLETDELPRRVPWERIASIVGLIGTAYFAITILALSVLDSDYSPITQAASDYGVGRYAFEMNLGFLIGGIGLLAFSFAVVNQPPAHKSRAGSILFIIAGAVLIMDSYFATNIEGSQPTLHGLIHGFGGLIFFITAPVGTILVSRKIGRGRFLVSLAGLVLGFALLAANVNVGGLAERVLLLVIFASVIVVSARYSRD